MLRMLLFLCSSASPASSCEKKLNIFQISVPLYLLIALSQDLPLEVELAGDLVTLLGTVQLPQPGALGNILEERDREE